MNNNPNWNNPQQQWNRPTPPPQKKGYGKWIILGAAILIVLSGIVFVAAWLGRKVGTTMGTVVSTTSQMVKDLDSSFVDMLDQSLDPANSQACLELIGTINADSTLSDSKKVTMTNNLNQLRISSDEMVEFIKTYRDGFRDTLRTIPQPKSNINNSYAYFIQTGRASQLKNRLLEYRNQAFSNLPVAQQDSLVLDKLGVYDEKDMALHPWQTQSWETNYFNKTPADVIITCDNIKRQVSDFERAILEQYKEYLSTPH
jgi:flagellar basal body-associated protein FliL